MNASSPALRRRTRGGSEGRSAAAVLAAGALLLLGASPAAVTVRFHDAKLTLHSRGAPARDVFSAIAEKTGVRFVVDREIQPGAITLDLEDVDLERAIGVVVAQVPDAAGHAMSYARGADGAAKLAQVALFGPGKAPAGEALVYDAPVPSATPDPRERLERMVEAGVPRETAEKVMELTEQVQQLQATPVPGTYKPEDLSPASREQLQPLVDRGVPIERAVQMLLFQEHYQETLKEISHVFGTAHPDTPQSPFVSAPTPTPLPSRSRRFPRRAVTSGGGAR